MKDVSMLCIFLVSTACKINKENESNTKNDFLVSVDQVTGILNLIGANHNQSEHLTEKRCAGSCHIHGQKGIQYPLLREWAFTTKELYNCLHTASDKMSCLRNENGQWNVDEMGFARTAVGTDEFIKIFKDHFGENNYKTEYLKFVTTVQMPPFQFSANNPQKELDKIEFKPPYFGQTFSSPLFAPLNNEEYKRVLNWIIGREEFTGNSLVYMRDLMEKNEIEHKNPPMECREQISVDLKKHIELMNDFGWTHRHIVEKQTPMFGCETIPDFNNNDYPKNYLNIWAKDCLKSLNDVELKEYGKNWNVQFEFGNQQVKQSMKLLKELKFLSMFWMRSSVDGRYISSGIEHFSLVHAKNSNTKGFVLDLKTDKYIELSSQFDPGFFPDNRGFTMIDGEDVMLCEMSIFDQSPEFIDLKKSSKCSGKEIGGYQHIAAQLSQNVDQDYYVVRGSFTDDNVYNTSWKFDPPVDEFAVWNSHLQINKFNKNNVNGNPIDGFKIDNARYLLAPYEGDFGVSPSGELITSRIGRPAFSEEGDPFQLGYRLSVANYKNFTSLNGTSNADLQLSKDNKKIVGEICLKGGKASMSYNERFLITHHTVELSEADRIELGYLAKDDPRTAIMVEKSYESFLKLVGNVTNIYLVDLWTMKKQRITNMNYRQKAIYPHFRADGWIYFLVRDRNVRKEYVVASNAAILMQEINPI